MCCKLYFKTVLSSKGHDQFPYISGFTSVNLIKISSIVRLWGEFDFKSLIVSFFHHHVQSNYSTRMNHNLNVSKNICACIKGHTKEE